MFKRISALLLVVVFVALAVAAYYLRDPNQFKQDLQDLAAEQSGYQVTINGDIRWRWALPFGVSAEDIAATADSETITVDRLTLGISFGSLFAAFDDWRSTPCICKMFIERTREHHSHQRFSCKTSAPECRALCHASRL